MTAVTVPATFPAPNGRGDATPARQAKTRTERPKRAWASLAAAIVLILASVGGWLGFDRYFSGGETPHLTVIPAVQLETDWPMYRGDPARNGAQDGFGPIGTPSALWTVDLGASAYRSPAVTGGVAYVGASDGTLHALDATTGEEHWAFEGDGSLEMTPSVLGGVVYIPSEYGTLYAIDAETGKELWTFAKPLSDFATPSYDGGLLFAGSLDGNLYAIDPATGEEAWRFTTGGPLSRCTAAKDGVVYTGSEDGFLYAIDVATGKELWKYDTQQDIVGTPTVANGLVYVTRPGGALFAVDAATGVEAFAVNSPTGEGFSPVSVTSNTIFSGSQDGNFYALDALTGEQQWAFQTGERIQGTPAIVGGVLYGASFDNHLYALEASTGKELWNYELDGAIDVGPSIANGVVYASTDGGTLYAIGSQSGSVDTAASPSAASEIAAAEVASTPASSVQVSQTWGIVRESANEGGDLYGWITSEIAPDGNIWVIEGRLGQIAIFSPAGERLETWGSPGSGEGQFNFLASKWDALGDIAFAPDGSFYVADSQNARIQHFSSDREFLEAWKAVGPGDGQFIVPYSVAVDSQGDVYVVDFERKDIQKFDSDGNHLLTFSGLGTAPGHLQRPQMLAIDSADNLWVADDLGRIQQFNSDGVFLKEIRNDALNYPVDLMVDAEGRIFSTNFDSDSIVVLDQDGDLIATIDSSQTDTPLDDAFSIDLDGQGNAYLSVWSGASSEVMQDALYKLQLPASLTPTIAQSGVDATPLASPVAQIAFSPLAEFTGGGDPLHWPAGMAFDDTGKLYIVDTRNERIVVLDGQGTVLQTWGEAGTGPGQFDFYEGDYAVGHIAVYGNDVYVSDARNNRIQQFTLDGTFVREWGGVGSADGQFDEPCGIIVDDKGRVLVADYGNDRVQIFDSEGDFIESWGGKAVPGSGLLGATDLAFDHTGDLYVTGYTDDVVYHLDPKGKLLETIGGPAVLSDPWGIVVDEQGSVFVADHKRNRIQVFGPDGTLIATFGQHGTAEGEFTSPQNLVIGPDGDLYVADTENNRIQIFSIDTPAG